MSELTVDSQDVLEVGVDAALAIGFERGATPEQMLRYLGALADGAHVEGAILAAFYTAADTQVQT